jgi:hypothetical protein
VPSLRLMLRHSGRTAHCSARASRDARVTTRNKLSDAGVLDHFPHIVTYRLPFMPDFTLVRYLDMEGRAPFQRWFERLGPIKWQRLPWGWIAWRLATSRTRNQLELA